MFEGGGYDDLRFTEEEEGMEGGEGFARLMMKAD